MIAFATVLGWGLDRDEARSEASSLAGDVRIDAAKMTE
jgi:hypothetical protein